MPNELTIFGAYGAQVKAFASFAAEAKKTSEALKAAGEASVDALSGLGEVLKKFDDALGYSPGLNTPGDDEGLNEIADGAIYLTIEQARDPLIYREAWTTAAQRGIPLRIRNTTHEVRPVEAPPEPRASVPPSRPRRIRLQEED